MTIQQLYVPLISKKHLCIAQLKGPGLKYVLSWMLKGASSPKIHSLGKQHIQTLMVITKQHRKYKTW